MARRSELPAALAIVIAFAACGDDDGASAVDAGRTDSGGMFTDGGVDAGPDAAPADAGPTEIAWERCELVTGLGGDEAECATIDLPLDWDAPDGDTIGVFVKRLRSGADRGQLWLLMGGPGGSAANFELSASAYAARSLGLDVYMLEHRGVGRSHRLGCPSYEDDLGVVAPEDLVSCFTELEAMHADVIPYVGTTAAARDLVALIDRVRGPADEVFVYGVSYGTWWGHRYLQIAPSQATAVILDSACPPGLCSFPLALPRNSDAASRALLEACAVDAECSSHLGSDPVALAESVLDRLDTGHCPEAVAAGLDSMTLRAVLGAIVRDQVQRYVIPAIVHRLDRCDAGDVAALRVFADIVAAPPMEAWVSRLNSPLLGSVVGHSEMWDEAAPTTEAEYQAFLESLLFTGIRSDAYDEELAGPRYTPDALVGEWAAPEVPVLVLNGTMDAQTPPEWGEAMATGLGDNARLVLVERATHYVLVASRYDLEDWMRTCGWDIAEQFFADPTATLDTSCTTEVAPHDFTRSSTTALSVFGTTSLYGPSSPGALVFLDAEALEAREQLRRVIWSRPW